MNNIVNQPKNVNAQQKPVSESLTVSSKEYKNLNQIVDVSCIATFLRGCSISSLTPEEREYFEEFQQYFSKLESNCYDIMGFE